MKEMANKISKVFDEIKMLHRKMRRTFNIFTHANQRARFMFCKYYENRPIDDNAVLFQSFTASSISCSPYYMLLEMYRNPKYKNLKFYVAASESAFDQVSTVLSNAGLDDVEVLIFHSKKYCMVLASAKYLVNNSTFPTYFIKKEGQIYVNTWHGTPLKSLGRHILNSPNELGNTQRNFICADYLIYPNDFTFETMRESYMLDQLYKGTYIVSGYPRNSILFDDKTRKDIRKKFNMEGKKVVVYMPTWRGVLNNRSDKDVQDIEFILNEIEKRLDSDTIFYAKLHNLVKGSTDFNKFEKIHHFPDEYETYEFLSAADCLITDYSSVLFDFAVTGRKIILYAYDRDEYVSDRGMYMDYDSLPFPKVYNVDDLASQLADLNDYPDYSDAMHEFIKYDNIDVTKQICEYIFGSGDKGNLKIIPGDKYRNHKENVIIFTGALMKNGITGALKSLMNVIDKDTRNYILLFYARAVNKNRMTIHEFSEYAYMPIQGQRIMTRTEAICQFLYYTFSLDTKFIRNKLKAMYEREAKRLFFNCDIDHFIHYSGYERKIMSLMINIDCRKIIYIHSNLIKESKVRDNIHVKSVEECYSKCDKLVAIREGMEKELLLSDESVREKLCLAHNPIDYKLILHRAEMPLHFDEDTECTVPVEKLDEIINDQSVTKFINISRFSPEKGLDRLIDAFEKVNAKHADSKLIVIGGHGVLYEQILDKAQKSVCCDNIIIIKSLSNVFPVLTKCSAFVLSSYYEGLPVTIMEALVMGKTVISTDIVGPKAFLQQGYGHLVEESVDGIAEGMCKFIEGTLPPAKFFDSEEFNQNAINEFEAIFK